MTSSQSGSLTAAFAPSSCRDDVRATLDAAGIACQIVEYEPAQVIFAQGDPCRHVLHLVQGGVKLSVVSKTGRQAVVAMLGPGEFFGEGCLANQAVRLQSATATAKSTILYLEKDQLVRLVHEQPAIRNRFIAHVLERSIKFEENLVDQLLNCSEQRLARTLLRLARNPAPGEPVRTIPPISQETLAEMVGTTRSRVNVFMRKFQRLGFIDRSAGLKVDSARLAAVLQD